MSPSIPTSSQTLVPFENRTEEQEADDARNRRAMLRVLLEVARDAGDLVTLAGMLGLDEELAELAGPAEEHPERHRRLVDAANAAQLEEEDL